MATISDNTALEILLTGWDFILGHSVWAQIGNTSPSFRSDDDLKQSSLKEMKHLTWDQSANK